MAAARELTLLTSVGVLPQIVASYTEKTWPPLEKTLRQKNPKLDATTVTELRKEFEILQVTALRDIMSNAAPIYARYFTAKELRDLVAFYKSPTGKKALIAMPQASLDMVAGVAPRLQQLSENANQKFAEILKQRGFEP
ncbi:MAG: DUF2059 domain-containing protein [Xanthobacteraceae bacterium]|nr:DUF2059 domain-containing protein [Xanthobacteraceae bacterium]